jgi:hypothetical protein
MKIYTMILIVTVLLVTASCATGGYRDDEQRRYQYSPYSSYPADYWNSRPDYGVPLPFHGPTPR